MTGSPTLQIAAGSIVLGAGTAYVYPLGGTAGPVEGENNGSAPYRSAGVLSNLGIRVTANATAATSTFSSLKYSNTAGNQSATIAAGGSGIGYFEDTTHTDSVTGSGDRWSGKTTVGAGGNITATVFSSIFTATTNTVSKLFAVYSPNITTATTGYASISGDIGYNTVQTTETYQKTRVTHAGTLKNLSVLFYISGTNTTTVWYVRKNAGNTTQTISRTAGNAGLVEDVTHTTTVAAGDDINHSYTTSGSTVASWMNVVSVEYENTNGYGFIGSSIPGSLHQTDNSTQYHALGGQLLTNTTEANRQSKASAAFTFSNLGVMVTGADSSTSNARLRKGGANVNLTITSTASTGGYYEDSTNTDVVAASDLVGLYLFASSVGGTHYADTTQIRISSYIASGGPNNVTKTMTTETVNTQESRARLTTKARAFTTETVNVQESPMRVKGKPRALTAETINTQESRARLVAKNRKPTTETVTMTQAAFTRLSAKNRALTAETVNVAEPSLPVRVKGKVKALATETVIVAESSLTRLSAKIRTLTTETITVTQQAFTKLSAKARTLTTETINTAESIDRVVSHGANNVIKTLATETVNVQESIAKLSAKIRTLATETINTAESSLTRPKESKRTLTTETLDVAEQSLTTLRTKMRSLATETITATEASLTRLTEKLRAFTTETINVAESVDRLKGHIGQSIERALTTETLNVAESTSRLIEKIRTLATESVDFGEVKARLSDKLRALPTETINVAEALDRLVTLGEIEVLYFSDSVTRVVTHANNVVRSLTTETLTLTESSLTRLKTLTRTLPTETLDMAETTARLLTKFRILTTETITVSEAVDKLKGHAGQLITKTLTTETLNMAEQSLTRQSAKIRALVTETLNLQETLTRLSTKFRTLTTETITVNEAVAQTKNTAREVIKVLTTETVNLAESTTRLTNKFRILTTETITVAEQTIFRSVGNARALTTETINVAEQAITRRITKGRVLITESITITESALTRLAKKIRALTTETVNVAHPTPVLLRARAVIKTMATETITIVQQSLVRQTAKLRRLLTHTLIILEAEIRVFKNGIELIPPERASRGGHTVRLKQPKLKQILYPVYSPVEFERLERRKRLREYPPLIVIPAFKYNINIVVAPFVITKLNNQVIVKFAIANKSPIILTGKVPIRVIPKVRVINQAKAKFVMTQAGIERAQTQTNKLNKLLKLMKLWFMATQLD